MIAEIAGISLNLQGFLYAIACGMTPQVMNRWRIILLGERVTESIENKIDREVSNPVSSATEFVDDRESLGRYSTRQTELSYKNSMTRPSTSVC